MARAFDCRYVLGVDIDAALIARAWGNTRLRGVDDEDDKDEVLQSPFGPDADPCCFRREDFVPYSRPPDSRRIDDNSEVPPECDDDGDDERQRIRKRGVPLRHPDRGYDAVLALSVIKWVHLRGGDAAIEDFFAEAFSVLRPGGVFVLEPQDWASYRKAIQRRAAASATMAAAISMSPPLSSSSSLLPFPLKLRPEKFCDHLLTVTGFASMLDLSLDKHQQQQQQQQQQGQRQSSGEVMAFSGKRRIYAFFKSAAKTAEGKTTPDTPPADAPNPNRSSKQVHDHM